jgi:pseudaminic acid biosynthesis-associated methylase
MTEQEVAWSGEHGNAYNRRSPGNEEANYHLFKKALYKAGPIGTILELGAGQGANMRALQRLYPKAKLAAVELNRQAAEVLGWVTNCTRVINASVLDWEPDDVWDLVLTKGLLIHIHPDEIGMVYEVVHRAARRWILLAEYYNPSPVNVPYRGRDDLLWKRDFAGEMLDRYKDLRMVDYGFVYHGDAAPQDDITWFLLEKSS